MKRKLKTNNLTLLCISFKSLYSLTHTQLFVLCARNFNLMNGFTNTISPSPSTPSNDSFSSDDFFFGWFPIKQKTQLCFYRSENNRQMTEIISENVMRRRRERISANWYVRQFQTLANRIASKVDTFGNFFCAFFYFFSIPHLHHILWHIEQNCCYVSNSGYGYCMDMGGGQ